MVVTIQMQSILSYRTETSRLSACYFATLVFNENHAESVHKCGAHSYSLRTESKTRAIHVFVFVLHVDHVSEVHKEGERDAHMSPNDPASAYESALHHTTPLYSLAAAPSISLIKLRVNAFTSSWPSNLFKLKRWRQPHTFWKSVPAFIDSTQRLNHDRRRVII